MGCILEISHTERAAHSITKRKRFTPYGTHPNFCFAKTSFMLETLCDIRTPNLKNEKFIKDVIKINQ